MIDCVLIQIWSVPFNKKKNKGRDITCTRRELLGTEISHLEFSSKEQEI